MDVLRSTEPIAQYLMHISTFFQCVPREYDNVRERQLRASEILVLSLTKLRKDHAKFSRRRAYVVDR